MKKSPKAPVARGPIFPVGSDVLIKRPHLWSGCQGEVVRVTDGIHLVKIAGKHDGFFHTEATGEDLGCAI